MDSVDKKAEELIAKFNEIEGCEKHYSVESDGRMCAHIAKQCAIICVGEILKLNTWVDEDYQRDNPKLIDVEDTEEFWEKVKERLLAKQ